jgi:hypothetical protein
LLFLLPSFALGVERVEMGLHNEVFDLLWLEADHPLDHFALLETIYWYFGTSGAVWPAEF